MNQIVQKKMDVTSWLFNVWGLGDGDTLTADEVSELAEMIAADFQKIAYTLAAHEVELAKEAYEERLNMKKLPIDTLANVAPYFFDIASDGIKRLNGEEKNIPTINIDSL